VTLVNARDAGDIERALPTVPRNQNSGLIVIARALFPGLLPHCGELISYRLKQSTRIGALPVTLIVSSRARSRPIFPCKRRRTRSW